MRCMQIRAGTSDRGICLLDGTNGGKRMVSIAAGSFREARPTVPSAYYLQCTLNPGFDAETLLCGRNHG